VALDADRRRRSWPYPPTDLERLAESAGLDDDELRASLRRQIAERRGCDVAEVVPAEIDWARYSTTSALRGSPSSSSSSVFRPWAATRDEAPGSLRIPGKTHAEGQRGDGSVARSG
jgi:hypothetical protein